jgi:hypothetical protein
MMLHSVVGIEFGQSVSIASWQTSNPIAGAARDGRLPLACGDRAATIVSDIDRRKRVTEAESELDMATLGLMVRAASGGPRDGPKKSRP